MAFMREYIEAGDPFRFRKPRFLKRLNLARFKGIGRFAQFIPGPVGSIAGALGDDEYDPTDDDDTGYSRGYGYLAGDPGKGGHKASTRHASEGRPKSGQKKGKKHKGRSSANPKKKGGGLGAALGSLDYGKLGQAALGAIPVVGGVAQELAGQLGASAAVPSDAVLPVPLSDGSMAMIPHPGRGKKTREPHMAHRKVDAWMVKGTRSMNPTNPHALRRSLRRLEGFEHMVKRFYKAFPRLRHAGGGGVSHAHKAGCRCKRCRG